MDAAGNIGTSQAVLQPERFSEDHRRQVQYLNGPAVLRASGHSTLVAATRDRLYGGHEESPVALVQISSRVMVVAVAVPE